MNGKNSLDLIEFIFHTDIVLCASSVCVCVCVRCASTDINISASPTEKKRENGFWLCALALFCIIYASRFYSRSEQKIYLRIGNRIDVALRLKHTSIHSIPPYAREKERKSSRGIANLFIVGIKPRVKMNLSEWYIQIYTSEYSAHKNNEDFLKSFFFKQSFFHSHSPGSTPTETLYFLVHSFTCRNDFRHCHVPIIYNAGVRHSRVSSSSPFDNNNKKQNHIFAPTRDAKEHLPV